MNDKNLKNEIKKMEKKEIKIQITKENYDYLMHLKTIEQNKDKNISDLINIHIDMLRDLLGDLVKDMLGDLVNKLRKL